jgi:hypothetical protein
MNKLATLILIIFTFNFIYATESIAQRGTGDKADWEWGLGSPCCKTSNTETSVTISGEVVSVDKIPPRTGIFYGIHLMVKTDKETLSVHLGSRTKFHTTPDIIAYEIRKGSEILVLRDENGCPAWIGWKRRTVAQSPTQQDMRWQGSGGWGPETSYGRMYNPRTVEVISGKVVSVDKSTPRKDMSYGVYLNVKTGKETISVHLGPGWYIENQNIIIEPGDKVEIKGSRITFNGKPAIIAAEVNMGGKILKLRDGNGFPAWSGWR